MTLAHTLLAKVGVYILERTFEQRATSVPFLSLVCSLLCSLLNCLFRPPLSPPSGDCSPARASRESKTRPIASSPSSPLLPEKQFMMASAALLAEAVAKCGVWNERSPRPLLHRLSSLLAVSAIITPRPPFLQQLPPRPVLLLRPSTLCHLRSSSY